MHGVRKQGMCSNGLGKETAEPQVILRKTWKNKQEMIDDIKKESSRDSL